MFDKFEGYGVKLMKIRAVLLAALVAVGLFVVGQSHLQAATMTINAVSSKPLLMKGHPLTKSEKGPMWFDKSDRQKFYRTVKKNGVKLKSKTIYITDKRSSELYVYATNGHRVYIGSGNPHVVEIMPGLHWLKDPLKNPTHHYILYFLKDKKLYDMDPYAINKKGFKTFDDNGFDIPGLPLPGNATDLKVGAINTKRKVVVVLASKFKDPLPGF